MYPAGILSGWPVLTSQTFDLSRPMLNRLLSVILPLSTLLSVAGIKA
jgi:hypothetical protein